MQNLTETNHHSKFVVTLTNTNLVRLTLKVTLIQVQNKAASAR